MNNDKLLIEFGNFILKDQNYQVDENDIKNFQNHLKSKCEKKITIMHKDVDGKTMYGYFLSYFSDSYVETTLPNVFDSQRIFIEQVNKFIEQGYNLV
jgi:hypothetical protein